jgi:hypothetical protein
VAAATAAGVSGMIWCTAVQVQQLVGLLLLGVGLLLLGVW